MTPEQAQALQKLNDMQSRLSREWIDYWISYCLGTWQFWAHLASLFVPLVAIYLLLDRRKALQIGFYGFNVHVWFTYIDAYGIRQGLWNYPFQIIPVLPVSFGLDASLVPVSYMLIYQWTQNRKRNYYVFAGIWSAFMPFAFKPFLHAIDMFALFRGTTYLHLFAGYLAIMLLSKWITDLFLHFRDEQRERPDGEPTAMLRLYRNKAR